MTHTRPVAGSVARAVVGARVGVDRAIHALEVVVAEA